MGAKVHKISNVDESAGLADCAGCGRVRVIYKPHKGRWVCRAGQERRSSEALTRRAAFRREWTANHFASRYGISSAEYAVLLDAQGGGCAICGGECTSGRRLAIDHDHATGRVRGLLCMNCNTALGQMRDRPELLLRAAEYLSTAS